MQVIIDFLPVVIFFVVYKLSDIYLAVTATAVASLLTFGYTWMRTRKIQNLQLVSLIIILIAAGLTLFFRDDTFIRWKPTLINGLFAIVFAASLATRTPLAERLFGSQINCTPVVWRNLTVSWTVFFLVCAGANYYVAFVYEVKQPNLSTELQANWQQITDDDQLYTQLMLKKSLEDISVTEALILEDSAEQRQANYLALIHQERWVNFKLFGLLFLTLLFVVGQGFYLAKHIEPETIDNDQPDNDEQTQTDK